MTRGKRYGFSALLLLVLLAAAVFVVPAFDASALRVPVTNALRRTLGRPGEFREVRLQLLPRPAVILLDLVIPEVEPFGREPIFYVSSAELGMGWSSLLNRRLEFSSVRLVDASLNFSLDPKQGWNIARLLGEMAGGVRAETMPEVVLESCRVNFRNGLRKSTYFLNTVDLELRSGSGPAFEWSFEASPARTDRAEAGLGRFRGEGRWAGPGPGGQLDIEADLESSAITEVTLLLAGRDLGLQGRLSSRARLSGPLEQLTVRGVLELDTSGRPSLFGLGLPKAGLPFQGTLNLGRQSLSLETSAPTSGEAPPVVLRFHASSILAQPAWTANAVVDGWPAAAFLELAGRLGARFPPTLNAEGTLHGEVSLSASGGVQGTLQLRDATVRLGGAGPLEFRDAPLTLRGASVELGETVVRAASGNETRVSGQWSAETEALRFQAKTDRIEMAELASAAASLPGLPPIPLLERCASGHLQGQLEFVRRMDAPPPAAGEWTGEVQVANTECRVEGAAEPLALARATLSFRRNDWAVRRLEGEWGGLPVEGSASFQPGARRPLRFQVSFGETDWARLEALFQPTLVRPRSFLERTLRLRRTAQPAWLAGRRVEGQVRFAGMEAAGIELAPLEATVYWDGLNVEVPYFTARAGAARIEGRFQAALSPDGPDYRLLATVGDWPWQGGMLDGDLDLKSQGLGPAKLNSLRSSGNFRALRVTLGDHRFRLLQGAYDLDTSRRPGRLRISSLEAQEVSGETWTGAGASAPDGTLNLDLLANRRVIRLQGLLWPPRFPAAEPETSAPR